MSKKVSQAELRQIMQKLKTEKGGGGGAGSDSRIKKYKLTSRELQLMEIEKKRKAEEETQERKRVARDAGVPENFFDSAKTKAFLNLNKAPQKSILKRSGPQSGASTQVPGANAKATGKEWTSSAPVLATGSALSATKKDRSAGLRTPAGGAICHDSEGEEEGVPADFFDKGTSSGGGNSSSEPQQVVVDDAPLPEGFFDDPVQDAKARGIEYKNPEEEEWEAFKKEIAVEMAVSQDLQAEGELEETTERQLEEIEDQMRAWSRVREIEIKMDEIEEKVKAKKVIKQEEEAGGNSDDDLEEEADEFLDWRLKKV